MSGRRGLGSAGEVTVRECSWVEIETRAEEGEEEVEVELDDFLTIFARFSAQIFKERCGGRW